MGGVGSAATVEGIVVAVESFATGEPCEVLTSRLRLLRAAVGDLEEVASLLGDERVWRHFPQGRHTGPGQTRAFLLSCARQWQRDGLGYWAARLRKPAGGLPAEALVGIGGCAASDDGRWWNLYYRLTPKIQRQGLAQELCAAALTNARHVNPGRPVIARMLEHNSPSAATAERAGLTLVWRGPVPGSTLDAVRLIYSDRPLNNDLIVSLARLT